MRISIKSACGALAAWSLFAGCAAPAADEQELGSESSAIINGTQVARGSEQHSGVVNLGGCTGTLVTNQHVITARHCVRNWTNSGWAASNHSVTATLEGTTAAADQSIASTAIREPTVTSLAPDWALVTLSAPMVIDNASDGFLNVIYSGSDANLAGKTVKCIGYGNSVLASNTAYQSGFGTLRTANMTVSSASTSFLSYLWNSSGQLQASGDSGGTCFYNGQITGVQSTCGGDGTDLNGNGQIESSEFSSETGCSSTAPGKFRATVASEIHANVKVEYTYAPASLASSPVTMTLSTAEQSKTLNVAATAAAPAFAVRSGWLEATVAEPARALCTRLHTAAPITGDLTLRGNCMDDGLLPVLL